MGHERRWRRHTNLYPFLSPSLPSLPILFSFPSPFLPSPSFLCFSLRKANFTQLLPSTSKMSTKLINKKIVSRTRAPPTKRKDSENNLRMHEPEARPGQPDQVKPEAE